MLPTMAAAMAAPVGVTIGREREPLAIRRPRRPEEAVGARRIALHLFGAGQVARLAAFQFEQPDIRAVAIARGDEGETCSIWRKHGCIFDCRAGNDRLDAGTIEACPEDVRLSGAVPL